jgi:hypothetical protein
MKVRCPHGHLIAEIIHDGARWVIEVLRPDEYIMLREDGTAGPPARYPAREALNARPWRMLACPRECMLETSWYRAESAELQRRAEALFRTYRLAQ